MAQRLRIVEASVQGLKEAIVKRISKLAATTAAAIVAATTFSTSAFADWRNRDETNQRDTSSYENRDAGRRDDERVTVEGRISNIARERDGYRVQLERSPHSFWVPERSVRGKNFSVGVNISLGGIFRRGNVYVDVIDYPVQRVFMRGRVVDVDYRRGVIFVKEDHSRRVTSVDVDRLDRKSRRFDIDDIRRGDYVDVWGDWGSRGTLNAYRLEERDGRWRY
jgi:hypothetical protein